VLESVFQPIVDLDDGHIRGVEALSRFMTRPRRSPETWFAEAAGHGLLLELELAAAHSALGHMHLVPEDTYVSVNASAATMCAPELVELLQGLPAQRVVLELTESFPIEDRQDLARSLGGLRTLGARLALDDVGKGFSGLGNVLEFSPDFMKFDRTLVSGVDTDLTKKALIERLTAFGDEVGVEVVAEGIETASELETLRILGVRNGQGFLLGRPGPIPPRTSGDLAWPGTHEPWPSPEEARVRTPA
jgi:EAL domain-containing protein (putative c-di-GMP-specific phosphodiesterase class I)